MIYIIVTIIKLMEKAWIDKFIKTNGERVINILFFLNKIQINSHSEEHLSAKVDGVKF